MEIESLKQEIDTLIAALGDETYIAKPATERAVLAQIRLILDQTRDQRTGPAHAVWEAYLPYAAKLCRRLSKAEEGWDDDLDYFVSENSQFWLDYSAALLEKGEISAVNNTLEQIVDATRLMQRDRIAQVDILLQALDIAVEISDKKHSILLYEEAEKVHRKHLAGGAEYAGSAWQMKIKKMGQKLAHFRDKLHRFYKYSETVTVSIEADTQADLERVIDYLQQNLTGKVKLTRRVKAAGDQPASAAARYQAHLKITLE